MSKTAESGPISRDDLEAKLRAFQGDVQDKVKSKRSTLIAVGGGVAVFLLILFFLLGKRSGKKKTTVVQIKRV